MLDSARIGQITCFYVKENQVTRECNIYSTRRESVAEFLPHAM